ncbi:MAG: VWA domain-containing protein [Desulfovibrio sp.]|nr:VWA domain-containing protein [Desulfovibrio sp.]
MKAQIDRTNLADGSVRILLTLENRDQLTFTPQDSICISAYRPDLEYLGSDGETWSKAARPLRLAAQPTITDRTAEFILAPVHPDAIPEDMVDVILLGPDGKPKAVIREVEWEKMLSDGQGQLGVVKIVEGNSIPAVQESAQRVAAGPAEKPQPAKAVPEAPVAKKSNAGKYIGLCLAALAVLGCLWFLMKGCKPQPAQQETPRQAAVKATQEKELDVKKPDLGVPERVAAFFQAPHTPAGALALARDLQAQAPADQDALFRLYYYLAKNGAKDASLEYAVCVDPTAPAWGTIPKNGADAMRHYALAANGAAKEASLKDWLAAQAKGGQPLAQAWLLAGQAPETLEVACLDPEAGAHGSAASGAKDKTGIVFVIDTTMSMGPYVDATKKIVREVYDNLQNSAAKDKVAMAVVAFRSNVEKRPATQYNTKIISDFTTVDQRAKLEDLLDKVEECRASTHAFDEDSMAGVEAAIDKLNWKDVGTRAMLLVSDAGPLAADDPTSFTHMSPEAMAKRLHENNIFMTVAHVKEPSGARDHAYAEQSYKELARMGNGRSSYIAIDAPDPQTGAANFNKIGGIIADNYRKIAEMNLTGKTASLPAETELPPNATPEQQATHMADAIMRDIMRRANQESAAARSAASEADSLFMTRAQAAQASDQLKAILAMAEDAFILQKDNADVFTGLKSLAAGKFIKTSLDDWKKMTTGERYGFLNELKSLIARMNQLANAREVWPEGSQKGECVFRVQPK